MACANGHLFPRVAQPFGAVLPKRLQQPIPHAGYRADTDGLLLGQHQRSIDELEQGIENVVARWMTTIRRWEFAGDIFLVDPPRPAAGIFGCLQRPAAREYRQPTEEDPFRLGEQLVAPIDQRPKRLLPRLRPRRTLQQVEAL